MISIFLSDFNLKERLLNISTRSLSVIANAEISIKLASKSGTARSTSLWRLLGNSLAAIQTFLSTFLVCVDSTLDDVVQTRFVYWLMLPNSKKKEFRKILSLNPRKMFHYFSIFVICLWLVNVEVLKVVPMLKKCISIQNLIHRSLANRLHFAHR